MAVGRWPGTSPGFVVQTRENATLYEESWPPYDVDRVRCHHKQRRLFVTQSTLSHHLTLLLFLPVAMAGVVCEHCGNAKRFNASVPNAASSACTESTSLQPASYENKKKQPEPSSLQNDQTPRLPQKMTQLKQCLPDVYLGYRCGNHPVLGPDLVDVRRLPLGELVHALIRVPRHEVAHRVIAFVVRARVEARVAGADHAFGVLHLGGVEHVVVGVCGRAGAGVLVVLAQVVVLKGWKRPSQWPILCTTVLP
jgi:hypothetical protein